jgi:Nucleotidyltransferase
VLTVHIEVLLAAPWSLALSAATGFPLANETPVQIANPASFLAHKILIHRRRTRDERAKDILYMHDTIETFATRIDELRTEWVRNIRHELHANSVRTVESAAATLFGAVTDSIRAASRIVQA